MTLKARFGSGHGLLSYASLTGILAVVVAGAFWVASAWTGPHTTTTATAAAAASAASPTSAVSPSATATVSTPSASPSPVTLTPVATAKSPTTLSVSLADLGVAGAVSVAVYDLDDGDLLTAGSGSYETASIVKVDILVSLLVQRNGVLTTGQKSLARSMITLSDNAAATSLFQTIGSAAGLNRTNKVLGLVETSAGTNGNWGLTKTTAADQLRLLKLVFTTNSLLSDASRTYVSSLMTSVSEGQDWGVTAAADDKDEAAVKNGWLQRTTTGLWDVTSIGCVQASKHRLLVVVLTASGSSMSASVSTIERAASAAVKRVLAA